MTQEQAMDVRKLIRPCYKSIKILAKKAGKKWKWKPKIGKWACYRLVKGGISEPELITHYNGRQIELHKIGCLTSSKGLVPVLHWEDDIEPVLEGMGGDIHFQRVVHWFCDLVIRSSKFMQKDGTYLKVTGQGNTRQEAMMQMTNKAAKEI